MTRVPIGRRRTGVAAAAILWLTVSGVARADDDLIAAASRGDVAALKRLIAKHADVAATATDGSTALHRAAEQASGEVTRVLLAAGANARAVNRFGVSPLEIAAERGNAEAITALLRAGADAQTASRSGETVLMVAARTGDLASVQALLAAGAKVDAAEETRRQTALMWATAEGHRSVVQTLLAAGANVNARSRGGFTPFLFAVQRGDEAVARTLLHAGADVNDTRRAGEDARGGFGRQSAESDDDTPTSALMLAILNGHYELASYLLDQGADPKLPDSRGSALHVLAWMRKPGGTINGPLVPLKSEGGVDSLDLVMKLIAKGANPNVRIAWKETYFDRDDGTARNPSAVRVGRNYLSLVGATPFYLAAHHGDVALMKVLADNGADPLLPTAQGVTPLMAAAGLGFWEGESPGPITGTPEKERLDAVKLAIALGGDVNGAADFGPFPIEGDSQRLLNEYAVNLEELPAAAVGDVRWSGSSALHGAAIANQPLIIEYLVERGAKVDARNKVGWTPIMVTQGMFVAAHGGLKRSEAEAALRKLMLDRGLNPDALDQSSSTMPAPAAGLTSEEQREGGWTVLFDGRTTMGWTPQGVPPATARNGGAPPAPAPVAKWIVQDGALSPVPDGGRGFLVSNRAYADFVLRLEFWEDQSVNSGVFIRAPESGGINSNTAYEVNISDNHATFPTASINGVQKTMVTPTTVGKWNTMEITAQRDHLVVVLNGVKAVDARNADHARGPFGLQALGQGTVKFRNIRIRELKP